MTNLLIYMQILGLMFGFSVLTNNDNLTKFQIAKVIFMSILPTLLYLNMEYLGIKGTE